MLIGRDLGGAMKVFTYQIGIVGDDLKIHTLSHSQTVGGEDLAAAIAEAKEITRASKAPAEANLVRLLNDDDVVMWVRPRRAI
jgi:hypothetical protein